MLISVQAGNSDNKLTQQEWSKFVRRVGEVLNAYEKARHFFGGSETYAPWQNVCWICEIDPANLEIIKAGLTDIRTLYHQDSVCLLAGEAQFI